MENVQINNIKDGGEYNHTHSDYFKTLKIIYTNKFENLRQYKFLKILKISNIKFI